MTYIDDIDNSFLLHPVDIVMAFSVMASSVMASRVMASRVMASTSYGLYSHGLYSHGLYSHGLYSHGLYSYGVYSYGVYSYGRVRVMIGRSVIVGVGRSMTPHWLAGTSTIIIIQAITI